MYEATGAGTSAGNVATASPIWATELDAVAALRFENLVAFESVFATTTFTAGTSSYLITAAFDLVICDGTDFSASICGALKAATEVSLANLGGNVSWKVVCAHARGGSQIMRQIGAGHSVGSRQCQSHFGVSQTLRHGCMPGHFKKHMGSLQDVVQLAHFPVAQELAGQNTVHRGVSQVSSHEE